MNKFILLLISIIISIFFFLLTNRDAYAVQVSGSSAALLKPNTNSDDNRAKILREFLEQYNSPLVPYAENFVEYADKFSLDWKLVAAISGVESTFGKQIPYNSYNGWGWGIYGDNIIRFASWDEGIRTVSQGLRENYMDKWGARDVYQIGRFYAASPTWASRVTYFMERIEEYEDQGLVKNLSISL
ncbi:glucosaminidase domain-containing protein [Candidatus Roizmanbacteria bacterium]|nr:glucosaminidase domain-containing protein [Candidatus Roizmanbacteria bacterium]